MLMKTHLAISIFAILFIISSVSSKVVFVVVALVATLLPDIDSGFSTMGRHALFKPLQFFTQHRGMVHSFTLCLIFSLLFAFYVPVLTLPFFLGYGLHLLVDSFTTEGIRPLWPLRFEAAGLIRVGGTIERALFLAFCVADLVLFVGLFFV